MILFKINNFNHMKRYFFIIITSFLLLSQYSCTDLLEQNPQGQWNEGDAIGGGFEAAVFDIYAQLRGFHITSGNTAVAIHTFRSEDTEKGSTAADGSAFALSMTISTILPEMAHWVVTGHRICDFHAANR